MATQRASRPLRWCMWSATLRLPRPASRRGQVRSLGPRCGALRLIHPSGGRVCEPPVRVPPCHPVGLGLTPARGHDRRPRPDPGRRRRRARRRAPRRLEWHARGSAPGHPARCRGLRARNRGEPGDPGGTPRDAGDARRELCRSRGLHPSGRGATRWIGSRRPAGRHGQRGHRPGGPLSLHRALLLGPDRPAGRHRAGPGLQRLAGGLLRRRSGPAVRLGHAAHAGSDGRGAGAVAGR